MHQIPYGISEKNYRFCSMYLRMVNIELVNIIYQFQAHFAYNNLPTIYWFKPKHCDVSLLFVGHFSLSKCVFVFVFD